MCWTARLCITGKWVGVKAEKGWKWAVHRTTRARQSSEGGGEGEGGATKRKPKVLPVRHVHKLEVDGR